MNESNQKKLPFSLYFILAFLCIVPILGGILGLILVLYSLVKKRDRALLIIGFAGIIVTITGVISLRHMETHRGSLDDVRIKEAKRKLKILVEEIEYYKSNYETYPKELADLSQNGAKIDIRDPIQLSNSPDSNRIFFYRIEQTRYYLFSRGIDGKLFTNDDIFPPLLPDEGKKTGCIIPDDTLSVKTL